jgi:hypothetical protein
MKGRDTSSREPSHRLGDESRPNSYKLRGVIISFLHFRMLTNRLPENSPLSANYNLLLCSLQLFGMKNGAIQYCRTVGVFCDLH